MTLEIWLHGVLTARAVLKSRDRKVVVEYADEGQRGYRDGAPILSCSLPSGPQSGSPSASRAFLEGLLPEGRALETAAARLRGVELDPSGAPAQPSDAVALLAEYGRECAGAVVVVPEGHGRPSQGHPSAPLSEDELAQLIRDLPIRPLGADAAAGIRMSLAGAQDKLLLTRVRGKWCMPVDGYPSTHILKPTTTWPNSAANEALVLSLSRACGLSANEVWTEEIGGTTVLVAERYDRIAMGNNTIHRLHQEDMCQAVGLRPKDKYQIGRPSERMASALREFADAPDDEIANIYRQVSFRAIVGDEDGHGKNYSLMLTEGVVTAAPLYDSLCTLMYPELGGSMGAPIGNQQSLGKVDRDALLNEARMMGIPAATSTRILEELVENIRSGLDDLPDERTAGWPSEPMIETILTRSRRLEIGEPLGGIQSSPRRSRTLDAATATRRRSTS